MNPVPLMLHVADAAVIEELSRQTSPQLLAAIQSPDWPSAADLPPAPNPWAAARHWLEKPWPEDDLNERRPAYFAKLVEFLGQPIPLDTFAVGMARLYLAQVGVSLGWRTAVVLALERVVAARLDELGSKYVGDAIAGLIGDRVPSWPPEVISIKPLGGAFEFECLLGLFKDVQENAEDGLAVAHAIHQWVQLAFDNARNDWRDYQDFCAD